MSNTSTAPPIVQHAANVNHAISLAESLPALVSTLSKADPAIAEQLTGSLTTYSRSAAAPLVGFVIGWVAAHYGMLCTDATEAAGQCWTPATVSTVTDICIAVCTSGSALAMHWWSKQPTLKVLAVLPPVPAPSGS